MAGSTKQMRTIETERDTAPDAALREALRRYLRAKRVPALRAGKAEGASASRPGTALLPSEPGLRKLIAQLLEADLAGEPVDSKSTLEAVSLLEERLRGLREAIDGSQTQAGEAAAETTTETQVIRAADFLRPVTREEAEEADRRWTVASERGRSYRDRALAEVGPFLSAAEVVERLGVSRATVSNWRRAEKLLGVAFDDREFQYPAWQFVDRPEEGERGVLPHLDEALRRIGPTSPWFKARLLLEYHPALGGKSVVKVLRKNSRDEVARALDLVEHHDEMGS